MMFIVRRGSKLIEWHVGEKVPEDVIVHPGGREEFYRFQDVSEIQADGDELEYIKTNFSHLPMRNHQRIVQWKGALAQFIYDNL